MESMQEFVEQGNIEGGGECSLIVTSYELRRKYGGIFLSDRRYGMSDRLSNGYTEVAYQSGSREIPILVSRFNHKDRMHFLDKNSFKIIHSGGYDWLSADDDGNDILKLVPKKHEYEATLYWWGNLINKAPNRNTMVTNLAI